MITSTHNPGVQLVRALQGKTQKRQAEQAFVIEGVRLAEEALKTSIPARLVLYTRGLSARGLEIVHGFTSAGAEVEMVSDQVMHSISETEASQGILVVMPYHPRPIPERLDFAIVIDNLRDPGNLGALMRSAAAGAVQAILLGPGTTDPYAPKVVRAAMGAHFRMPVLSLDWLDLHTLLKNRPDPLHVFLADTSQGQSYWQANLCQPCAFVLGGEAEGASPDGRRLADSIINIPMPGQSESLNVAAAAAILIFEVVRQRANLGKST